MRVFPAPLLIVGAVIFFLLASSLFIVTEREQAIVFQFGEAKASHREPGLKWKLPLIQDVRYYSKQALHIDPKPQRVILAGKKILIIDSFAYYKISDPLLFFQKLREEERAESNIGDRINSTVREVLSKYSQQQILSPERAEIMENIRSNLNRKISSLGVELIDVRIGRADLPRETEEAVYARMVTEREREAKQLRAEGEEAAQRIRSRADKMRTVLIAEAERDAQTMRGEGDAKAIKLYADAFNADPDFYGFYRSLEAYRKSLSNKDTTTLLLSPDSAFFEYLDKPRP